MWAVKVQETISERPEEEDFECSINEIGIHVKRDNMNKTASKIEKLLDVHREEKIDYDYLINSSRYKGRKKLLESIDQQQENYDKPVIYRRTGSLTFKNPERKKYIGNIEIISSNFNEDLKIKERIDHNHKRINSVYNMESQKKEELSDIVTLEKKKGHLNEKLKIHSDIVMNFNKKYDRNESNKEELEMFSSIKSTTNTEKIRQYIRYKEAWNYFISLNLSEQKKSIIVEDFSVYNCCYKIYLNCTKRLVLENELIDEREAVFAIAKVELNYNDEFHLRMITTLYKTLTGELECPNKGSHWQKIGFQNQDPKIDLRYVGMFGILQTIAFLDKFLLYAKEIFYFSVSAESNQFPLLNILIILSNFSLQALREGYLISNCNTQNSVIVTINQYFFVMIDNFFTRYKNTKANFETVHIILDEINEFSKKNTKHIRAQMKILELKYPQSVKDSMSLEDGLN